MIALFLIPLFLAIDFYIFMWFCRWLGELSPIFKKLPAKIIAGAIIVLLNAEIYIAFPMSNVGIGRSFKSFGNYVLGSIMYVTMAILLFDLVRVIVKKIRKKKGLTGFSRAAKIISGILVIAVSASTLAYGFINARIVRTTNYDITVDKDGGSIDDLNLVLLADLHMGYNIGISHIQSMVDAVNAADPDIIVIAGDIFDNDYDALEDPEKLVEILKTMKSKYGVYVVYGNHDIAEKLLCGFTFTWGGVKEADERMDQFIEDCGWINLRDEGVMIADSFYLYGRPDYHKPGKGVETRKTPSEITADIDPDIPVIVLEHEPVELSELSAAGVDVDLCGHTHDGQFFPMNISNSIMWENGYGYLNKDGMHSIVTSGVGLYGPYMRVCTIAEIVQVNIHFAG